MFTISYNDVESIHRHQTIVDIKYGSLNQQNILQCQVERVCFFFFIRNKINLQCIY
jgi:hypothetical protein